MNRETERLREEIATLPVIMPSSLPKQFVGTDLADQILQRLKDSGLRWYDGKKDRFVEIEL